MCLCRLLQLSKDVDLDLAHLTWCSALDSQSDFMMYMQISPIVILRYGTYVDTAAPLFSWPFLQQIVLPTLVEAQTGMSQQLIYSASARLVHSTDIFLKALNVPPGHQTPGLHI